MIIYIPVMTDLLLDVELKIKTLLDLADESGLISTLQGNNLKIF